MLMGGIVSLQAGDYVTYDDELHGCPVYYEVVCTSNGGEASTRVYANNGIYTRVDVGVTLYVINRTTGAVSEYGSDTDDNGDYATANVDIQATDKYLGYYASSAHNATVTKDGSSQTSRECLMAYN